MPNVVIDGDLKEELFKALEDFDGTLFDARTEERNLEDELGMHPDQSPYDRNSVNPDPRDTILMIRDWLGEGISNLDAIVNRLENEPVNTTKNAVYQLVAGSVTNISDDYKEICNALNFIDTNLTAIN